MADRNEILIVAHYHEAWYVFSVSTDEGQKVVSGPYSTHTDAVKAVESRSYRLAQGWEP